MAHRSRKRGRRGRGGPTKASTPRAAGRSEHKDAAVRATLTPLAPGERPWAIKIGALLAALIGGLQLLLFALGVKLEVAGSHPQAGSTIIFAALMFVCAGGMWLLRYWAVLGFMALLALLLLYFTFALIKASSLLGFAIAIAGVCVCGFLFLKLVRVLGRIQMPKPPGR